MDQAERSADLKVENKINAIIAFFGYGLLCLVTFFILSSFYYKRALLITDGVVDTGIVVSYKPSICGSSKSPRTCHYHQVYVPNLGSISLDLGHEFKLSSSVIVTYQRSDKSNFLAEDVTSLASLNFFQKFCVIIFLISFWFIFLLSKNLIKALK